MVRPEDLTGKDRELYESFRSMGMDERGALIATVGRHGLMEATPEQSMQRSFEQIGMSEAAAADAVRELTRYVPTSAGTVLQESAAVVSGRGQRYRARLIKGDVLGSSGYYSKQVLESARGLFAAGTKVFVDHPAVSEAFERPERSVRDLAGRLASTAVYQGDGLYSDIEVFPHMVAMVEGMRDHIGLSIRATGTVSQGVVAGRSVPVVESIDAVQSVDFVTAAGAGGGLV